MKKKILIIGKKSFIGSNLKNYLSKFFDVNSISYDDIKNKKKILFSASYIINTSLHKNYIGKKYGITVSNGTAALEVAIKSLNLKPKSHIIIPNFSIISTALAVIKNGHIPISNQ